MARAGGRERRRRRRPRRQCVAVFQPHDLRKKRREEKKTPNKSWAEKKKGSVIIQLTPGHKRCHGSVSAAPGFNSGRAGKRVAVDLPNENFEHKKPESLGIGGTCGVSLALMAWAGVLGRSDMSLDSLENRVLAAKTRSRPLFTSLRYQTRNAKSRPGLTDFGGASRRLTDSAVSLPCAAGKYINELSA